LRLRYDIPQDSTLDTSMALPALKLEMETRVKDRVGKLEANVEHIQEDVADMKVDIRRLGEKIDGVKDSLATLAINMEKQLGALTTNVEKQLGALATNMEKQLGKLQTARGFDRVWWLLNSAVILGVMARGFKWI
jgi:phage shock protein A